MNSNLMTHADAKRLIESQLTLIQHLAARVARSNRLSESDEADFVSFVLVKLLEDDCARIRKFSYKSTLRTFLSVVVTRLFIDFARHEWGRFRPSAKARRLGPIANDLIEQRGEPWQPLVDPFEVLDEPHLRKLKAFGGEQVT